MEIEQILDGIRHARERAGIAPRGNRTVNGGKWDLEGQRELEQADAGYETRLGRREDYQAGFRAGFRRGYTEGFGPR